MAGVIVVGAGVVGSAIAFRLATGGVAVTLLERGEPGGGTSARSFAWINAYHKPPRPYHDLNLAGLDAHRRLRDVLGGAWLHETGGLVAAVGDEAAGLAAHVAALREWAYPAELISPSRAAALEPRVRWPEGTALAIAHFPAEGWVHGPTLARALVDGARRRGAAVRVGAEVAGILLEAGRVRGVRLTTGDELPAENVVIAAGRWTDAVAARAGVTVPLAPTRGLLAVTSPVPGGPRGVVHVPGVHFRPDGDGRVVLQDAATDATVTGETPPDPALPACDELLRRARAYLPDLAAATIEEVRLGIRPLPADGFPIVGPVAGRPGLYLAVTHSGMTLGPLLGELVAAELLGGPPAPLLAPFRPERCVGVDSLADHARR